MKSYLAEGGDMEPGYSDPNYSMRRHAERQELQRTRQEADLEPVDQARFEQQLGELQPLSFKESSPDTPDARSGDNTQRTTSDAAMCVPQEHNLRDSSLSNARYSADVPRGHLGPGSDGLDSVSSGSMRYEAPLEVQSKVRTDECRKPLGLLSRVKSGLGNVLGGSRREKSSGDPEDVTLRSELHIRRAKRKRPSAADQALFIELRKALTAAHFRRGTINNYSSALRGFSEFLQSKDLILTDVLGHPDLLTACKDEFIKGAGAFSTARRSLSGALHELQIFQAGGSSTVPSRGIRLGPMYPADEQMISQFEKAVREYGVAPDGTSSRGTGVIASETIKSYVRALRHFARWLREHDKETLARLYTEPTSLGDDLNEYIEAVGDDNGRLSVALSHLCRLGTDGQLVGILSRPRLMGHKTLAPYREDAVAIDRGLSNAPSMGEEKSTATTQASRLRSFSDWLQRESRPSIVNRIDGTVEQQDSLRDDIAACRKAGKEVPQLDRIRAFLGIEGIYLYDEDASLIEGLTNEELNKPNLLQQKKAAARRTASTLREFGEWLRTTGRTSIASRINGNVEQRHSLDRDYQAFTEVRGDVFVPLSKLRQYAQIVDANRALGLNFPQQRVEPSSSSALTRTLPQTRPEAELPRPLIEPLRQAGLQIPADLSSTSTWLQDLQLPSFFDFPTSERAPSPYSQIYQGLSSFMDLPYTPPDLRDDARSAYVASSPERAPAPSSQIYQGLSSFADLPYTPQDLRDDARSAYFNSLPERAPAPSSQIYQGLSSFADLPYTPQDLRDDARSAYVNSLPERAPAPSSEIYQGLSSFMDLPYTPQDLRDDARSSYFNSAPERAPAPSSEIYQGLSSFVDLPSTPRDLRDEAQSRPVLSPAGAPPFFIGPSGVLQQLEDIGHLVGEDWQHRSQAVPDYLLNVLDNKMLLPNSGMVSQPVTINRETYSITMGPQSRYDFQFVHHPGHFAARDAQAGPSVAAASSADRSGRVLGSMQWLGDEHIQRDYELLSEELQQSNPDLAARTRFVDPLMAFQVAHSTGADALRAFHIIVVDRNGDDTADFLFLPVNNASVAGLAERGTHWSLLLVDRRNRDRPVAYHYDSAQGHGNAGPAATLAAAVGANLRHGPIAQQRNSYDCGVFVVDGTRALARRLAGGRQVDLNLSNLVVDRQELQNRLKSS
ncbi:Ulp1 family isopeptidase [Bradyrhizobium sp. ORS 285]|uniref:Ulp1 family isopeptidase n=2 Tax=Bradyrhizobium sp. ORS 285 TaxID=115808 RepID=UPI000680AA1A|nr:Ulp1 family isopeptidase [Bradyrhizobium sp. ORS 285]